MKKIENHFDAKSVSELEKEISECFAVLEENQNVYDKFKIIMDIIKKRSEIEGIYKRALTEISELSQLENNISDAIYIAELAIEKEAI